METNRSLASPARTHEYPSRTTFAVQFVFEVESHTVAETMQDLVPGPETMGVAAEEYRSYVDSAGLARPAVGVSVPFYDRRDAEVLYETISGIEDIEQLIHSGILTLRAQSIGQSDWERQRVLRLVRYS